jgi:hypothetical protein
MGKPYIYSIAIRVSILISFYYSYCREGNSDCATQTIEHRDDCLGAKAPVIAVSTAYKPVVNATRRKFTSHFNVSPFQRLQ